MSKSKERFSRVLAVALLLLATGCKSAPNTPAPIVDMNSSPDPSDANLAPVSSVPADAPTPAGQTYTNPLARVLGRRAYPATSNQANREPYPESAQAGYQEAPQVGYNGPAENPNYQDNVDAGADALYAEQPPPALPDYQQPELTRTGDEWTPGYWSYAPSGGYFWVPGAWVAPPYTGALWTPPYWGYEGRRYRLHRGFWGVHIGFYGGVPYGFGYTGQGYHGGYWNGNNFYYNREVNRVNVDVVRNVYVRNVTVFNNYNRAAYNGPGGIAARPSPAELAVYREGRTPAMQSQVQLQRVAESNRRQFYQENHGQPEQMTHPTQLTADLNLPRPTPIVAQPGPNAARPQQPVRAGAEAQRLQQSQPSARPGNISPQQSLNPLRARQPTTPQPSQRNLQQSQLAPEQHPQNGAVHPQGQQMQRQPIPAREQRTDPRVQQQTPVRAPQSPVPVQQRPQPQQTQPRAQPRAQQPAPREQPQEAGRQPQRRTPAPVPAPPVRTAPPQPAPQTTRPATPPQQQSQPRPQPQQQPQSRPQPEVRPQPAPAQPRPAETPLTEHPKRSMYYRSAR